MSDMSGKSRGVRGHQASFGCSRCDASAIHFALRPKTKWVTGKQALGEDGAKDDTGSVTRQRRQVPVGMDNLGQDPPATSRVELSTGVGNMREQPPVSPILLTQTGDSGLATILIACDHGLSRQAV